MRKMIDKVTNIAGDAVAGIASVSNASGKKPFRIINIGGTTSVTGNITVYETDKDMIVVDVGIGFPDSEMLGVDVVIPDFSYILENKHKLRGIIITHAHEDHFGAVPYLLKEVQVPVYGTKLVHEFVKTRLVDRGSKQLADSTSLILLDSDTPEADLGDFKVSAFRMNHSVPMTTGLAIKTPQGTVLHIADFKVDWTPVIDKPLELGTIARHADEGVICLLSDCLGVVNEGYAESESTIDGTFDDLFERAAGRQILITTISSNLSRMSQIISAAIKHGRKVVLEGRSIKQSVPIGIRLGLLKFEESVFVTDRQAKKYLNKDLVYIVGGCYGQVGSSLERASRKDHRLINIEEDAMVIFSADPNPPGAREAVGKVQDNLTLIGAEVIYSEIQPNLHVSGHGLKGDIQLVVASAKAEYFIPIGGTITRMRAYKKMVGDLGFNEDNVFENIAGDVVEFKDGKAKKVKSIDVEEVLVEGAHQRVSPLVLQDRGVLSNDGVFVVIVPIDEKTKSFITKVEIVSRGFVHVKEAGDLVGGAKTLINNLLQQNRDKAGEWGFVKSLLEREVAKFLRKKTGGRPMVIVHGIKV